MTNFTELTISQLTEGYRKKEFKAVEVTEAYLKRIEEVDSKVKAYLEVCPEIAIFLAKEADKSIEKNEISYLTGIPAGIKDVLCTKGIKTTCASKILENFIPPYDATVIEKLYKEKTVILGKLNMDEFAMGSSTENSAFITTKNPWDLERIPGGSSGGSSASVASRTCAFSLGSDTGGSIRQPASHCGVVGLKPTYGRVSRYGLIAFASSLDQIGPLTKDVRDCAVVMNVIAGQDNRDSTSSTNDVPDFTKFLEEGLDGITVGIPKEYFVSGMDRDVEDGIRKGIEILKEAGAKTVDISLPHSKYAIPTYYIIAPCEASSNLSRFDGVKYGVRAEDYHNLLQMYKETRSKGFGEEVKRRIMLGTYSLSAGYYDAYYKKASQVRTLIKNDFNEAFKKCDIIAAPVAPTPAFKIGEKSNDPIQMYLSDVFTISVNMAGIPALSLPVALSGNGLPIGFQIMANHFQEGKILKSAYNLEKNLQLSLKIPNL